MRSEQGLFIVFEGGDGVGKSTQIERLWSWLSADGHDCVRTFEPGDSYAGQRIRDIVLNPATGDLSPRAEALLYAADKAHHVYAVVRPALERGAVVVCDRYVDSLLAYQGAGRVLGMAEVEELARWATEDLRPNLTVLLDADPSHGLGGILTKDRLESAGEALHERARQHFLELAAKEPDYYLVLDARQSIEDIEATVRARVEELLSVRAGRLPS